MPPPERSPDRKSTETPIERKQALAILRRHGIQGADVYLIDLLPLIEMIWADGKAQDAELAIFDDFLVRHVAHVNRLAGYPMLTPLGARQFVLRFLRERPDPEIVRTLRAMVAAVRLGSSDEAANQALRSSLLATCVDIAASAVTTYPYGEGERFDAEEKRSFFEILDSVEGDPQDG